MRNRWLGELKELVIARGGKWDGEDSVATPDELKAWPGGADLPTKTASMARLAYIRDEDAAAALETSWHTLETEFMKIFNTVCPPSTDRETTLRQALLYERFHPLQL